MENALTGIIIIGVMILAILGLSEGALSAQANLAEASRAMQERLTAQARTDLQVVSATVYGAFNTLVDITVKNTGSSKLADFAHWDVIVEYTDTGMASHIDWYPYGTSSGTWSKGIYQTAATLTAEKLEPDILNPGEEMIITVHVQFTIETGLTNVATIATPNGIAASVTFVR